MDDVEKQALPAALDRGPSAADLAQVGAVKAGSSKAKAKGEAKRFSLPIVMVAVIDFVGLIIMFSGVQQIPDFKGGRYQALTLFFLPLLLNMVSLVLLIAGMLTRNRRLLCGDMAVSAVALVFLSLGFCVWFDVSPINTLFQNNNIPRLRDGEAGSNAITLGYIFLMSCQILFCIAGSLRRETIVNERWVAKVHDASYDPYKWSPALRRFESGKTAKQEMEERRRSLETPQIFAPPSGPPTSGAGGAPGSNRGSFNNPYIMALMVPPKTLSPEEIAALSPQEQQRYAAEHQEFQRVTAQWQAMQSAIKNVLARPPVQMTAEQVAALTPEQAQQYQSAVTNYQHAYAAQQYYANMRAARGSISGRGSIGGRSQGSYDGGRGSRDMSRQTHSGNTLAP